MADENLSAEELKWRAESDARALARSNEIHEDPMRLAQARNAAGQLAKEEAEQAKDLQDVSRNMNDVAGNGPNVPNGGGSILDVFKPK